MRLHIGAEVSWLVLATLMSACGGDSAGGGTSDLVTDTGGIEIGRADAAETVDVRFVNLWADEGNGASVDVYLGFQPDSTRRVFTGVGFGEVTDATQVPAETILSVYLAGDPTARITSASGGNLQSGTPLTLVLRYFPPVGGNDLGGAVDVFTDSGESIGPGHGPARDVDGMLLVGNVSAAGALLGADPVALTLGSPGAGCLRPAGSDPNIRMGGTATISFDVPPGELEVGAYTDEDLMCSGTPRIGPTTITVPSSGRSYLFAYGTGPADLRLLHVAPGS